MPTGYTADVQTGKVKTLREFALTCARNFGIAIFQRDESHGPIREVTAEDVGLSRYRTEVDEASANIIKYEAMSKADLKRETRAVYERDLACYKQRFEAKAAELKRYNRMLEQAVEWNPPTTEHQGLKKFMIEQLQESIKFDCGWHEDPPKELTAEEYRTDMLRSYRHSLEFYEKKLKIAEKQLKEGNEWIRALDESLPKK